ncbi:hypothetical protein V2G26_009231 [Clonostachys chloroleuca]
MTAPSRLMDGGKAMRPDVNYHQQGKAASRPAAHRHLPIQWHSLFSLSFSAPGPSLAATDLTLFAAASNWVGSLAAVPPTPLLFCYPGTASTGHCACLLH